MGIRFLLLISISLSWACAPRPQERSNSGVRTQFGPSQKDTPLSIQSNDTVSVRWKEEKVSPTALLRLAENLVTLELPSSFPEQLLNSLPKSSRAKPLSQSSYSNLLSKEATPMAQKSLEELIPQLEADRKLIFQRIVLDGNGFQINENASLDQIQQTVFGYAKSILSNIDGYELHPTVRKNIKKQLLTEITRLKKITKIRIEKIISAHSLTETLSPILATLQSEKITLDDATAADIRFGQELAKRIDSFQTPQEVLALIIDIWNRMTPQERLANFKTQSKELFEYLLEQDESDLNCLRDAQCGNPFKVAAKRFRIFPKIEEFGIEKLRSAFSQQGHEEIIVRLTRGLRQMLSRFPQLVADAISSEFQKEIEKLQQLKFNFSSNFKERFSIWSKKALETEAQLIPEFIPKLAQLNLVDGKLHLQWVNSKIENKSPENFESALTSFLARIWDMPNISSSQKISTQLSQIEQIVNHYTQPLNQIHSPSANTHIESLRASSKLVSYFFDWRVNNFDSGLGRYKASELFPEYDSDELNIPLFPKEALLALSLLKLGHQLQPITEAQSPVFVLDTDKKVTWADQLELNSARPAVMAGIVEYRSNARSIIVKSEHISRYILALTDLIRSIEYIEKSKSPYLTQRMESGKTAMETIIEARGKIRLLILGLANYLSHQFKSEDNLIVPALDVNTQEPIKNLKPQVLDQLLAIRALMAASELLGIGLYQWEAQDLYSSANKNMFNLKTLFYGAMPPNPLLLTEGLLALRPIRTHLPPGSQAQLSTLLEKWEAALINMELVVSQNHRRH